MDTGGQDTFGLAEPEFESPTLVREAARDESAITSLTLKYDMGWSELTSVTGYFWRDDNRLIDGTQYDSAYIGASLQDEYGYGGGAISGLAAPAQFETNINQIHQEIRLSHAHGFVGQRTHPGLQHHLRIHVQRHPARCAWRSLPGRPRVLRVYRIR
jgi:hypothetical protein